MSKNISSFSSMAKVVEIQNNILSTISNQKHSFSNSSEECLESAIKAREIESLKLLKDKVLASEENFYRANNLNGYMDLYNKVQEWNSSGIMQITKNTALIEKIQNYLSQIQDFDLEKIYKQLEQDDSLWESAELLTKNELLEIGLDCIEKITSMGFKGGNEHRRGTFYITIDGPERERGTTGAIFKHLNSKGFTILHRKNNQLEIRFTQNIPKEGKKKIKDNILKAAKEKGKNFEGITSSEIGDNIREIILQYLPTSIAEDIKKTLDDTIKKLLVEASKVDINRTSFMIRGALEEICVNAFAEYFNFPHQAVGLDVKSITDKQLPVDILFKGAGAQIKNYKEVDGVVTFNQHYDSKIESMVPNKVSLYTFLSGAAYLQLDPVPFGKFYFSEQFNKEIPEGSPRFAPVARRFAAIRRGIDSYVEKSLDKLLNFNHDIILKDINLVEPQFRGIDMGRPAFFFINDKPIPTSALIDDLIEGLEDSSGTVFITFKNYFLNISPFEEINETWSSEQPNPTKNPDLEKKLRDSKVEYTIDVDVVKLIEKLKQKF